MYIWGGESDGVYFQELLHFDINARKFHVSVLSPIHSSTKVAPNSAQSIQVHDGECFNHRTKGQLQEQTTFRLYAIISYTCKINGIRDVSYRVLSATHTE